MMTDRDNSGALFKNDRKEKEGHPDYRGEITVAGTAYWISAWLNQSQKGTKYMGLKVTAKEEMPAKPEPSPTNDLDDDLPF